MNGHIIVDGLLKAATGLAALVADRIYPDVMPDAPNYPAVTYQKLSGSSARGAVSDPPLMTASFQVSSWAKSRAQASKIAAQARKALDRKRKITVASVALDDCFYESDNDDFDGDSKVYFNHMTFTLHYRDAT
ncbi:MAG: hypothetical protein JWQ01_4887 [Massilia sp.]|nr:hypothetical protein [Massilia sp.]